MPGGHGGVRREHASRARGGERVVERDALRDLLGRQLERRQRGMPLVEVQHAGLDPERAERAHGAEAEQAVLAEAGERVPLVEASRDPAVDGVVHLELGVEQVERHAPDLGPPDVERDVAPEELEGQRERRPVRVEHVNGGQPLGHDLRPVLVLQPGAVDALLEVPLAVEQPDADHGQREVARRLEDVTGERAQPARVDRQRRVDAELGADEDDRAVEALDRRLGPVSVLLEHPREPRDPLERRPVRGRDLGRVRREVGELAYRVSRVDLPRVRVERAEELGPVGIPGPAVVERDPRERRELGRKPQRELGGPLVGLPCAGKRRDVHDPSRAHGPTPVGP